MRVCTYSPTLQPHTVKIFVGHTWFVLGTSRMKNHRLFILTEIFLDASTQISQMTISN